MQSIVWELAQRLSSRHQRRLGRLGARLAIGSVALAIAVMEVALGIASGFETAITAQLVGLAGDIQLQPYLAEANREARPLARNPAYLAGVQAVLPALKATYPTARKAAILQANRTLEGVVLKGVPEGWAPAALPGGLLSGSPPTLGDSAKRAGSTYEVLLSTTLARQLGTAVGKKLRLFFLEERIRARPVVVAGLYETGLEEYDAAVVICDLGLIQTLNGWTPDQVEYLELHLATPPDSAEAARLVARVNAALPPEVEARSVYSLYPELFSWIGLQHQNVRFLTAILLVVVIVNLASALLIRLTEQIPTVGLLSAVGARPGQLIRLFVLDTTLLLVRGLVWGNVLGLGLLALQDTTGLVPLPEGAYFVKTVPVGWPWGSFLAVHTGVVLAAACSFVLPAVALLRLKPAHALRYT